MSLPGSLSDARRALRLTLKKPRNNYADDLEVAYMRLLVAARGGCGVRLTTDEVMGLITQDSAVELAMLNIEAELLGTDEPFGSQ